MVENGEESLKMVDMMTWSGLMIVLSDSFLSMQHVTRLVASRPHFPTAGPLAWPIPKIPMTRGAVWRSLKISWQKPTNQQRPTATYLNHPRPCESSCLNWKTVAVEFSQQLCLFHDECVTISSHTLKFKTSSWTIFSGKLDAQIVAGQCWFSPTMNHHQP